MVVGHGSVEYINLLSRMWFVVCGMYLFAAGLLRSTAIKIFGSGIGSFAATIFPIILKTFSPRCYAWLLPVN